MSAVHGAKRAERPAEIESPVGRPAGDTDLSTTLVMVPTPCFGGLLTQGYVELIVELAPYAGQEGFRVNLAILDNDSTTPPACNTLVAAILDAPDLTQLMFINTDIEFPPQALGRLLRFNQEVAAGFHHP